MGQENIIWAMTRNISWGLQGRGSVFQRPMRYHIPKRGDL